VLSFGVLWVIDGRVDGETMLPGAEQGIRDFYQCV
jgi:hypothetical protein